MHEPEFQLATYLPVLIYLVVILLFAAGALITAHVIGPLHKTPVKQMPYESGMDPIGDTHQRFDVKFYLIAILFLVFDVELLFLYPWAVIAYSDTPGGLSPEVRQVMRPFIFVEMLVFIATLVVAYIYAWRKGVFQWR
jgi:NADH:ubiquinone oxidoreductase subunit 3 (subunit A)